MGSLKTRSGRVQTGSDRQAVQLVVVDGDDTLWFVEPLYDQARSIAGQVVAACGLDAHRWEAVERERDVANAAFLGVDRRRFPTSCVEAYEAVAFEMGKSVDPGIRRKVWEAGNAVFEAFAPPAPEAASVIDDLRRRAKVVLLTKGDFEVQQRRVRDADLVNAFDEIRIVPTKTATEFRAILDDYRSIPGEAWSIGNSLLSDIYPALNVGMYAVWIEAHVWEYEHHDVPEPHDRLMVADSLRDVPKIIFPS